MPEIPRTATSVVTDRTHGIRPAIIVRPISALNRPSKLGSTARKFSVARLVSRTSTLITGALVPPVPVKTGRKQLALVESPNIRVTANR